MQNGNRPATPRAEGLSFLALEVLENVGDNNATKFSQAAFRPEDTSELMIPKGSKTDPSELRRNLSKQKIWYSNKQ